MTDADFHHITMALLDAGWDRVEVKEKLMPHMHTVIAERFERGGTFRVKRGITDAVLLYSDIDVAEHVVWQFEREWDRRYEVETLDETVRGVV